MWVFVLVWVFDLVLVLVLVLSDEIGSVARGTLSLVVGGGSAVVNGILLALVVV